MSDSGTIVGPNAHPWVCAGCATVNDAELPACLVCGAEGTNEPLPGSAPPDDEAGAGDVEAPSPRGASRVRTAALVVLAAVVVLGAAIVGASLGRRHDTVATSGSPATSSARAPGTAGSPSSTTRRPGATAPRDSTGAKAAPASTAPAPPTTRPIPDDLPEDPTTWCEASCRALASSHLDHPVYGSGTLAIVAGSETSLAGVTFTSDRPGVGVVWGQRIEGDDLYFSDGASDRLGHLFLGVGFGGPGQVPLVVVPTATGFDTLGTGDPVHTTDYPFNGSDYVDPYQDVDNDGRIELINVSKSCVDDCMSFTWTRSVWTWDGTTFAKTVDQAPIPPPEGWG